MPEYEHWSCSTNKEVRLRHCLETAPRVYTTLINPELLLLVTNSLSITYNRLTTAASHFDRNDTMITMTRYQFRKVIIRWNVNNSQTTLPCVLSAMSLFLINSIENVLSLDTKTFYFVMMEVLLEKSAISFLHQKQRYSTGRICKMQDVSVKSIINKSSPIN